MNAKKMLAISMCMLLLAVIPASLAFAKDTNATTSSDPKTTDIGRTIIRGVFFNLKHTGLGERFFALRIHYSQITGTQTSHGVVRFQHCDVGTFISGYIREAPFGMFGYMAMATFRGGITIV